MKTFKEFYYIAYSITLLEKTFSSREDAEKYHKENPPFGGEPYYIKNKSRKGEPPAWRPVRVSSRKRQDKSRDEKINHLTSQEDLLKGKKKAKKIKSSGLEVHHITPLNYSSKLKSTMSPDEWRERISYDASRGVYHGHHPKNLMGAIGKNTPEKRRKRGILHRAGGAHDLERQTKDLYSRGVSHKDLLAAAHRRKVREDKKKNK